MVPGPFLLNMFEMYIRDYFQWNIAPLWYSFAPNGSNLVLFFILFYVVQRDGGKKDLENIFDFQFSICFVFACLSKHYINFYGKIIWIVE